MVIPLPERPLASFAFSDIDEGVGNVVFWLYGSTDNTATTYHLSKNQVFSGEIVITTVNQAVGTLTYNFDSGKFQSPKVVNGDVIVTFDLAVDPGGSGTYTTRMRVKFFHYDGSTATQKGDTWVGAQHDVGAGASSITKHHAAVINVPRTKFRKDEQIRIEISMEAADSTTSTVTREIGIDPMERDGGFLLPSTTADETTIAQAIIPFELNF